MTKIFKLLRNVKGATAIEYGLIAALIAVAGVAAFSALGSQIKSTLNNATSEMKKG
jgi:pilus assembly protein Flp/PilA